MLTKTEIQVASGALYILETEGATFSPSDTPSTGLSAYEAASSLLSMDADQDWIVVEFREEAVCFSIQFQNTELANTPVECIDRAMMVRRALLNMSSN